MIKLGRNIIITIGKNAAKRGSNLANGPADVEGGGYRIRLTVNYLCARNNICSTTGPVKMDKGICGVIRRGIEIRIVGIRDRRLIIVESRSVSRPRNVPLIRRDGGVGNSRDHICEIELLPYPYR